MELLNFVLQVAVIAQLVLALAALHLGYSIHHRTLAIDVVLTVLHAVYQIPNSVTHVSLDPSLVLTQHAFAVMAAYPAVELPLTVLVALHLKYF